MIFIAGTESKQPSGWASPPEPDIAVLNAIPLPIAFLGMGGRVVWANESFVTMLGRSGSSAAAICSDNEWIRTSVEGQGEWVVRRPASSAAPRQRSPLSALANLLADTQRIGRIGGWEWDVGNGSQTWSDEVYRIFDHQEHGVQPTLGLLLERVHPEDRTAVEETITTSVDAHAPFDIHHRIVRPGGEVRYIHQRGEPAQTTADRGRKIVGTVRDETDEVARGQELRRVNRALLTLSACNRVLVAATDEQSLIDRMCEVLVGMGKYGAAWFVQVCPESGPHVVRGLAAANAAAGKKIRCAGDAFLTGGLVREALETGAPKDCMAHAAPMASPEWMATAGTLGLKAALALPLYDAGGACFGVLTIGRSAASAFCDQERELLLELAADLAFGLAVMLVRQESTERLQRLENSMEQTIQALALTIEKRDPYTAGHQRRVADLAQAIGRRLGLSEDDLQGLRLAATVHDIGKIYVPSDILCRPGRLSSGEFSIIQEHCRIGFDILRDIDLPWPVAEIVLQHHERFDGSGYPSGLRGDVILLGARIIGVADTVEAMASHRPYRAGLGLVAATNEIRANAGRLYDPAVVDACVAALEAGEGPEL